MRDKIISLSIVVLALSTPVAAGGWNFGIGTGIGSLDIDGVAGFNTPAGAAEFDASLKPDELREYTESAFGFGGFAKKGDLTITYSLGQLELQEDVSASQGPLSGKFDMTFTTAGAEVLVGYTFSRSNKNIWDVKGGLRYTSQEYEGEMTINGTQIFDSTVDDEWTDAVIGLGHTYVISPTTTWSSQVDVSSGDSEGTSHLNTGINWIYNENWVFRASVDVKDIEYQNGDPGDSDYFLYDADETNIGASFLYIF